MIRHQGHHSAVAQAPARAAVPAGNPGLNAANGSGQVTLDNLDNSDWGYFYEPAVQTLWLTAPVGDGRGVVHAHSSTTLSMAEGLYRVRVLGSAFDGMSVTVYANDRSTIGLARVMLGPRETLQATVFERGQRKGSGTLTDTQQPPATETAAVEQPATTTIVYDSPYYYGAPYYYGYGPRYYYGRPYYGSGVNFNFGFGGGHRH
jgi:hypothetical protein